MVELSYGNVGIKPGWSRLNLNYFIPDYELKFIVKAIQWIAEKGYLLLKEYRFDDKTAMWKNIHFGGFETCSLMSFNCMDSSLPKQPLALINREEAQQSYFVLADEIAAKAKLNWDQS